MAKLDPTVCPCCYGEADGPDGVCADCRRLPEDERERRAFELRMRAHDLEREEAREREMDRRVEDYLESQWDRRGWR